MGKGLLFIYVEKGFMIFLIATFVAVNRSFAEQTSPNAPIPTGWRSVYLVVTSKTVPYSQVIEKIIRKEGDIIG